MDLQDMGQDNIFLSKQVQILNKKNITTRYITMIVPGTQVKKQLKQRMLINEIVC